MINSQKVNARMKELDLTQTKVAAEMNIAQSTLNGKINNVRPMDLEEAELLQRILKIADSEFGSYFFTTESRHATKGRQQTRRRVDH